MWQLVGLEWVRKLWGLVSRGVGDNLMTLKDFRQGGDRVRLLQ